MAIFINFWPCIFILHIQLFKWGNSKEGDEYYDDDEEYYDDEEYGGVSLRCKEKKRENVYTPHPA